MKASETSVKNAFCLAFVMVFSKNQAE